MPYDSYFAYRFKSDMQDTKEMNVIGTGFQHLIDSYFWYLPFASVRQCKYIMEMAKIPDDVWMPKREALADEHKTDGARESLVEGFKTWLQSDLFKSRRSKLLLLPTSTQPPVVRD